jgi:citronellyl-CoA dehydrogenase
MPGLVPGIHDLLSSITKDVDGRDKPGHDGVEGPASMALAR